MGNVHARQYRKLDGVALHAFDADSAKLETFCTSTGASPAASYEDLIAKVDAIDLCLPTDLHVPLGIQALESEKALLLEKPAAPTYESAMKLVEVADKKKVAYMVAHVVRYFRDYRTLNAQVRAGAVGKVATVRTRRGGGIPFGRDWFMDHTRSGGVILDVAIHEYDWLRWTFGEPVWIDARSRCAKTMQGPDYSLSTLTFEDGTIAHVEATWMDPSGFRTQVEVSGSEGLLQFDSRLANSVTTYKPGSSVYESPMDAGDDPYFNQISDFVAAVRGEKPVPVTGYDGARAVRIAEAALESARTQSVVRV